jgi:ABC-type Mn2+/Zn2+ transport system ATPase subunit
MEIQFQKIKKGKIFCEEFSDMQENNKIVFSPNKIAIVYGPNGTGKTSVAKVLAREPGAEYTLTIDGVTFTEKESGVAHVISDQNDRNIIQGSTEDFILGANIKKEYELKKRIDADFINLFESKLVPSLKSKFGISTKKTQFDKFFLDNELLAFISDIANTKSKGKGIERSDFVAYFNKQTLQSIDQFDESVFKYFVDDFKNKDSAIRIFLGQIFKLDSEEKAILKLEENDEAVKILKKFDYLNECIVCDHEIDPLETLNKKQIQYKTTLESLGERTKKIIDGIISKLPHGDPFNISSSLKIALRTGDAEIINTIKVKIEENIGIYPLLVKNHFIELLAETTIIRDFQEYQAITKEKPQFEHEDVIFIEKFLNECLDRQITLERDENGNLRLLLGESEFLNHDRKQLLLSNGEQNFLSLAFELLRAQKSNNSIVILDDPISSFDSIYKNKIAYAILKLLDRKNTVILTHNTDLIKLMEHQRRGCFKLYYLNNTDDEQNGFISINERESAILLYIPKFLELLRGDIKQEISDELTFLVAIAPFMRGCCQLFNMPDEKELLTKLMHGYECTEVNLSEIYKKVIGDGVISGNHIISANDIIQTPCVDPTPLIKDRFPMLSKTLTHTYTYLHLRLTTEKTLVDKYSINTNKFDMLTNIITAAFKGSDNEAINNRVFFLSRKTLLNEFNHFDMDMNIFQPAIDITNRTLEKEKRLITEKLNNIMGISSELA